jgi:TRAP-type C4-dicarboxylate transport system permease small subunit
MLSGVVAAVVRVVRWFIISAFGVMISVTFAQVLCRYVLRSPLPWSEELARYCFVWIVFLGATLGLERGVHIGVDILTILLPPWAQQWLTRVTQILILIFTLVIIAASIPVLDANRLQFSPALDIQMAKVYLAIPLGMAVMAILLLGKLVEGFQQRAQPGR